MNAVIFPFTYISETEARYFRSCFSRIKVLMPSARIVPEDVRKLADLGWLSLETVFKTDEKLLIQIVENYHQWADQHGAHELKSLVEQMPAIPYYDHSSVHRLREEIKARSGNTRQITPSPDPQSEFILKSRVFLLIAQKFDEQQQALRNDLTAVESMEYAFHRQLHQMENDLEVNFSADPVYRDDDDRAYLVLERLKAWTCFLLQRPFADTLFVTNQPPVIDRMIDIFPGIAPLLAIDAIPVADSAGEALAAWRGALDQWLCGLAAAGKAHKTATPPQPPRAKKGEKTVSLRIYRADQTPFEWFGRVTGSEHLLATIDRPQKREATFVAYVGPE